MSGISIPCFRRRARRSAAADSECHVPAGWALPFSSAIHPTQVVRVDRSSTHMFPSITHVPSTRANAYNMASDKVSQDSMTKYSNVFFLATHSILSALAGKHYDSFNRPCVVAGGNVRIPIAFSRVSVNHKILHEVQQAFLGLHYVYAGAYWKT